MHKQELKEELHNLAFKKMHCKPDDLKLVDVLHIVDQLDEPQKPTVSSVALEYYEAYVDKLTGFDEWFGDFFDRTFLEEFPRAEELSEWLYDNDTKTNLERELALATLIVKGPSAVKVEQEKLYIVTLPNTANYYNRPQKLCKGETGNWFFCGEASDKQHKFTESEIRKDFEWAWREGFAKEVE